MTESDSRYHDARIIAPFDPDDPRYKQPMTISIGVNKDSKQWRTDKRTPDVAAFIKHLAQHPENKEKDGWGFVPGDMLPGQRRDTAVREIHAVILDCDLDPDIEATADLMVQSRKCCLLYTTHTHLKDTTEIKRDDLSKFAPGAEHDTALVQRYLAEKRNWPARLTDTATVEGTKHTTDGIMVVVRHKPLAKIRIVFPLATPFAIKDFPTLDAAKAAWRKIVFAVAEELGVADQLDATCARINQMFYHPRHEPGAEHETMLCGGDLFDWTSVELDDPLERLAEEMNKGSRKTKTPQGQDLGRWASERAAGFQIVDCIEAHCPEKIRGYATVGMTIQCPFADTHTGGDKPDDTACFSVNGGEGTSGWFVISCRHGSCDEFTQLDMLGKMIADPDEWFGRDALDDDRFYPEAETAGAAARYAELIDALTPDSSEAEIQRAAKAIISADLSAVARNRATEKMVERLRMKLSLVKAILKEAERSVAKDKANDATRESGGRVIFRYKAEFNFDEAVDVCSKALLARNAKGKLPTFCQMDGNAVRLSMKGGRATFEEMKPNGFWSELNKLVTFVRYSDESEGARKDVDRNVATHVYEQAYETLPPAPEVIYTPVYRKDGSLLLSPKYHFDSKEGLNHLLILNDLRVPEVPREPTQKEMREALRWIRLELLSDFPFLDTDLKGNERREPSEANALAMLLTPFTRQMIQGRTPLFFIVKPQPGTGGTLLASLPMQLFDGEEAGAGTLMSYTSSEEEMEKRLTAAVLGTRTHLFFDDVREFNNQVLLRNITAKNVEGRILGQSKMIARPNTFNWIATGNNPRTRADMRRRTCWIRLNAQTADVAKRKFRHSNFEEFVSRNRGEAIRHILTLIEFWQEQGANEFTERGLPGFDDWARKVGGVLQACGVGGFLDNRPPIVLDPEAASETEFLRIALAHYRMGHFMEPMELFNWAEGEGLPIVKGRTPDEKAQRFGDTLRELEGRTFEAAGGAYTFRAKDDASGNVVFGFEKRKPKKARS